MVKYKLISQNDEAEEGKLLPMKESPEKEAEKTNMQQNKELCNFIKNAFVADGNVSLIHLEKPIKMKTVFIVEDSKRGNFIVAMKT